MSKFKSGDLIILTHAGNTNVARLIETVHGIVSVKVKICELVPGSTAYFSGVPLHEWRLATPEDVARTIARRMVA